LSFALYEQYIFLTQDEINNFQQTMIHRYRERNNDESTIVIVQ